MGCGRGNNDVGGHHQSRGCVCEVVRSILEIQNAAVNDGCNRCTTNCFLEPLGGIVNPARHNVNTRVFTLLNKDGSPFFATFKRVNGMQTSCGVSIYFRVEDVFDGCCATLRVLVPLDECKEQVPLLCDGRIDFEQVCNVEKFEASDSCVTVDLDCFCAVQCIDDVHIDCD